MASKTAPDHQIDGIVYVTHSCKYLKPYKQQAEQIIPVVCRASKLLSSYFDLPKEFKILIKPIRCRRTRGEYSSILKKAYIDPVPKSFSCLIDTIGHEACHAEQHHQRRLVYKFNDGNLLQSFEGSSYPEAKNHQQYQQYPWEVEARKRGFLFLEAVKTDPFIAKYISQNIQIIR